MAEKHMGQVEFIASLLHQKAPRWYIEKCCAEIASFDVFEAHRKGEVSAEVGALILYLRGRSRMTWFQRVWEAFWL